MGIEIKKGQVIAQFTVEELLPEGSGGMATVVCAVGHDGSKVALKISHAATERYYADALLAEVEILRKLNHPGVVKIIPIKTDGGKIRFVERAVELKDQPWFFAMEFLSAKNYAWIWRRIPGRIFACNSCNFFRRKNRNRNFSFGNSLY